MSVGVSIIIPACNEEAHIAGCIDSLLEQDISGDVQVVFAANACRDATVEIISSYAEQFEAKFNQFLVELQEQANDQELQGGTQSILPAYSFQDE